MYNGLDITLIIGDFNANYFDMTQDTIIQYVCSNF